jgi:hypothetical protein
MAFGAPGGDVDSINLPVEIAIDYDNISYFEEYIHPEFNVDYLVMITSQFGGNKVNVYGFGRMDGMDYDVDEME